METTKKQETVAKTECQQLKESGFSGFVTIRQLMNDIRLAPAQKGVYVILRKSSSTPVTFIANGTGGFFKGKNPNVKIEQLEKDFLPDAQILYIGKAGGASLKATLQSRLSQYMQFGQGLPIGHWGGRYIWQIQEARDLLVCWKPLVTEEPREVEKKMIAKFKETYGKRPFANLRN